MRRRFVRRLLLLWHITAAPVGLMALQVSPHTSPSWKEWFQCVYPNLPLRPACRRRKIFVKYLRSIVSALLRWSRPSSPCGFAPSLMADSATQHVLNTKSKVTHPTTCVPRVVTVARPFTGQCRFHEGYLLSRNEPRARVGQRGWACPVLRLGPDRRHRLVVSVRLRITLGTRPREGIYPSRVLGCLLVEGGVVTRSDILPLIV